MLQLFRTRDVIVHFKTDSLPVAIHPDLLATGWAGGQGVMWTSAPEDEFMVTRSDGRPSGFLLWGSDEIPDRYTGMTFFQTTYGYGTFCMGGWLISTATYEKFTWNSRTFGPPLVPIVYAVGDSIMFSNRGLFTNEDEWALSGDPRAPNDFGVALVVQVPRPGNNHHLVLQTLL